MQQAAPLDRRSYTVPEAATVAGTGTAAIYKAITDGRIPHIRMGKKIIIPRHAFHVWLDSCGQSGGGQTHAV